MNMDELKKIIEEQQNTIDTLNDQIDELKEMLEEQKEWIQSICKHFNYYPY